VRHLSCRPVIALVAAQARHSLPEAHKAVRARRFDTQGSRQAEAGEISGVISSIPREQAVSVYQGMRRGRRDLPGYTACGRGRAGGGLCSRKPAWRR